MFRCWPKFGGSWVPKPWSIYPFPTHSLSPVLSGSQFFPDLNVDHLFLLLNKEWSPGWHINLLFSFFITKKTAADGKRQEIIVLDSKRSNAINIGLTVLPPPRTIKIAILNFDEYALNKEGIEVRQVLWRIVSVAKCALHCCIECNFGGLQSSLLNWTLKDINDS